MTALIPTTKRRSGTPPLLAVLQRMQMRMLCLIGLGHSETMARVALVVCPRLSCDSFGQTFVQLLNISSCEL